jgi:hypothetical protein
LCFNTKGERVNGKKSLLVLLMKTQIILTIDYFQQEQIQTTQSINTFLAMQTQVIWAPVPQEFVNR